MKQGELILAPGPDHAVVLGWRSPFDGRVAIRGSFNNRQTCCGNNSQVNWYVERGSAPDRKNGFKPEVLAQGVSDDKVNSGLSPFEVDDVWSPALLTDHKQLYLTRLKMVSRFEWHCCT